MKTKRNWLYPRWGRYPERTLFEPASFTFNYTTTVTGESRAELIGEEAADGETFPTTVTIITRLDIRRVEG